MHRTGCNSRPADSGFQDTIMANNRFTTGSGAYTCRMCHHLTRDTGGDGASVQLCDICYDLCSEDNSLSDTGELSTTAGRIAELLVALDQRNGDGSAAKLFPAVCKAAGYQQPAPAAETNPELHITKIGMISHGIDGSEEFILVERLDDAMTPDQCEEIMLPRYYRACGAPGSYFCTSVMAVQQKYSRSACILTIQHRYDV
jgi:hypothetical protein